MTRSGATSVALAGTSASVASTNAESASAGSVGRPIRCLDRLMERPSWIERTVPVLTNPLLEAHRSGPCKSQVQRDRRSTCRNGAGSLPVTAARPRASRDGAPARAPSPVWASEVARVDEDRVARRVASADLAVHLIDVHGPRPGELA